MVGCSLIGAATLAQALDRIAAYAAAHPEKEWISGSGWRLEWFAGGTPGRAALDAVVGDRPAFLLNRDGHGAWASSAALRRAGLDRRTPDPPDGRIEREDDGTPAGHPARGRGQPGRPAGPRAVAGGAGDRAAAGPAAPAPARHHRLAGRHRGQLPGLARPAARLPGRRVQRPAHRAGARRAVVGPGQGRRAARRPAGPARARPGGPVQRRHREDHAGRRGRELHRGHDRPLPGPGALPRRMGPDCPTSTPRRCGST